MPARAFGRLLKSWWSRKGSLGISLGVTAVALAVYTLLFVGERPGAAENFLQRIELETLDLRFQWRGRVPADTRIVIVDIDQRSQEVLGRWPFPRSHFATLLDVLREDGARVVAFDIVFNQPDETVQLIEVLRARLAAQGTSPDPRLAAELARLEQEYNHDRRFAEALERYGRAVLGCFFLYSEADLKGLDPAAIARHADLAAYFTFPQVRATESARGFESYRNLVRLYAESGLAPRGVQANIAALTEALPFEAGSGYFNVLPDADGVVRRVPLALPFGLSEDYADWDLYPSIEVQAVRLFLGLPNEDVVLNFSDAGVHSIEFGRERVVLPDAVGRVQVNYHGPAGSYPYVSLADVVQKNFPPGAFRNKLVLVGASATGLGDLRTTPFGGLDFPGVEIHANAVDNILNGAFLQRDARQVLVDLGMILLFGVPVGLWLGLAPARWTVLPLALLLPFAAGVQWAFEQGWWLNVTVPALVTLVPNTILVGLYRVLVEDREKRRVRGAFQHYLSAEVIRQLLESPELVAPRKTDITVLFSDIRGFTSISEKLDAQELALFLNEYLTEMTRIVFDRGGTLDKYIGDAVMAFWNAPVADARHPENAARAALEMIARLRQMQQQWAAQGRPVIDIGVGLNTGAASVGNMGSELRYGYTAMGDTVNLAARLEALTREYNVPILMSEAACAALDPAAFLVRELDLIRVKGKQQPVVLFELVAPRDGGPDAAGVGAPLGAPASAPPTGPVGARHAAPASGSPNLPALEELVSQFAAARALYKQRRWAEAQAAFEDLLARWPDDGPARLFVARCRQYAAAPPPADWDGVFTMTHK